MWDDNDLGVNLLDGDARTKRQLTNYINMIIC